MACYINVFSQTILLFFRVLYLKYVIKEQIKRLPTTGFLHQNDVLRPLSHVDYVISFFWMMQNYPKHADSKGFMP